MRNDRIYQHLKEKMELISTIPPQRVGPLTPLWKRAVFILKNNHLKVLTLSGFATSVALWMLFGASLVSLVSLLQNGF